ncbi:MAG TPA: type I glyceraldehyde-3-phosphate dehydrogenase [Vicinamibacteria bacterium]|nr:type I glyceraldehyde-3-phosphate dehydrogenase [Vicinamibacteria bacterium]
MGMRIAINGFGRIGRNVFRVVHQGHPDVEVVGINDITDPATLAHLLKYDSVHGPFQGAVKAGKDSITVDGRKIRVSAERDPARLPHAANEVDFAVESTGRFTSRADCAKHLDAGAARVLLTVPAKDEIDAMVVMGVNERSLKASDRIISCASCTTNCVAPMAKVLHDAFGVVHGLMTTVHAYTNDQQLLDLPHKDLRRARAAAINIIPTTTGAARAVGKVIPDLKGKLDGFSLRVPVPDGSVTDLVVTLSVDVTVEEVNGAFQAAAKKALKGIVEFSSDPLVSSDIVRHPASCILDSLSTMVIQKRMVKVIGWYDNEWGYSNRVVELMKYAHKMKLPRGERARGKASAGVS